MKRALVVYAVVVIFIALASGIATWLLQDKLGSWTAALLLPMAIAPFIMAYVGHRISGAVGNPFRGLQWGSFSWYALVWFAGLLTAGLAIGLCFGLNLASFDLTMSDYTAMIKDAMVAQGQDPSLLTPQAIKMQGWGTFGVVLLLGPFFGAAMGCLGTFPHFGWFGRRVLVQGRTQMFAAIGLIYVLTTVPMALMDNPQMADYSLAVRAALMLLSGISGLPMLIWLFFKTRSAVLPALAAAAYSSGWAALTPFISDAYPWLVGQQGVIAAGILLAAGLGLWFMQDPGGNDLAVAAVAYDGTPLTPEQAAAYESGEHHDIEHLTAEVAQETVPPPDIAGDDGGGEADESDV